MNARRFFHPALCVFEQGLSSAGSFLVLWAVARWLGPAAFGTFAAVWVVLQFGVAVASAWASTALSSIPAEDPSAVAGACLRRLVYLLGLLAVVAPAGVVLTVPELRAWPATLLSAAVLALTFPTAEFLRRYCARRRLAGVSAAFLACRWVLAGAVAAYHHLSAGLSVPGALAALCLGDALAMLAAAWLIWCRRADVAMRTDPFFQRQIGALARPLLVHHAVTAADGVVLALAVRTWIGNTAYGAYAAVGSLAGVVAVLVQWIDIHYASALVRRQRIPTAWDSWRFGLVATAAAATVGFALRGIVVQTLLPGYAAYSLLLPLAIVQSVLAVCKQIGVAQLRVAGAWEVYYLHGVMRLAGTALAVVAAAATGKIAVVAGVVAAVFLAQCLGVGWLARRERRLSPKGQAHEPAHLGGGHWEATGEQASDAEPPGVRAGPGQTGYSLWWYRGRPVLALPQGSPSLRLAALSRYQPRTLRRAAFRGAIGVAIRLRLDSLAAATTAALPPPADAFPLAAWLEYAGALAGQRNLRAMVVWPDDPHRKRLHVHLLRPDGRPAAFAKIVPPQPAGGNGFGSLNAEARALAAVQAIPARKFHVPGVIAAGRFAGWDFLMLEAVPAGATPLPARRDSFPAGCVAQYRGAPVRLPDKAVRELPWWGRWHAYLDARSPVACALEQSAGRPATLCRVHGDLGPANLLCAEGDLWIVDWEHSVALGPVLADAMSYYLGLRPRRCRRHPRRVWEELQRQLEGLAGRATRHDVLLALAFLCGAGREDALALARALPERYDLPFCRAA